ncbi:unnamed protein product [Miscanthus lutarioriparius]|uniref:DDE Tnp4 domain-containing protein n=1 Tax=Miscanthus lutarioriparius TaxID=422564 RepID=A0A811MM50_9POAL|nr:unnamed protein product [Miscanthus lutarioriparius]
MQESSQPVHDKFRRSQCCEQLITILGRTPRDRGELVSAEGHQPDKSPSSGSPRTPLALSDKPVQPRSGAQPSKRVYREYSVNSPRSSIMSSTDESSYSDTSSDGPSTVTLVKAAVVLLRLKGRYYLADASYMNMLGYMTPFRNTRYHINDFRGVELQQLQREEKFNYIHAKLRNVIERRFGVLKEHWQILNGVPYCKRMKQSMIIISCFALENYLWMLKYGADPPSYEVPERVELNRGTPITGVRELISMVVWSGIQFRTVEFVFNIDQGLPVLPEWLSFNRVTACLRQGYEIGPARLLVSASGGHMETKIQPHEAFAIGGRNSNVILATRVYMMLSPGTNGL